MQQNSASCVIINMNSMATDIYNAERCKASARPLRGPCAALAGEVRRLLGWEPGSGRPFLSTRAAAAKCGLSNSTVGAVAAGERPSRQTLDAIASGIGGNASLLGTLAAITSGDVLDALALTLFPRGTRTVRVHGESLRPHFQAGDVVFVRQTAAAEAGRQIVWRREGESLPRMGYAAQIGDSHAVTVSGGEQVDDARVVGIVEGFLRIAPSAPDTQPTLSGQEDEQDDRMLDYLETRPHAYKS